jgi:hypothetical protein
MPHMRSGLISLLILTCVAANVQAQEAYVEGEDISIFHNASLTSPGLKIDSKFTVAERAAIARGASLIPACQRHKLNGLRFVRSQQLDGPADECSEGFYPGNGSIVLYPRCGFGVHIIVHEIFHHLGRFNNLNGVWKSSVLRKIPRCPVSDYAADGLGANNEDLAETGRLLLLPESGDRRGGACVDQKIRELARILAEC